MNPRAPWLERAVPAFLVRWEGVFVCLLAWGCFVAIPLSVGELGLGSDALNHQIYLGWTAWHHRFDHDFLAAGYQSFQSPYLYWPLYRMAVGGWTGVVAGVILASVHVAAVWPVWMLARVCVPGSAVFELAMRVLAVALAFASSIVLSAMGASMNDVLAAVPLVWAVALGIEAGARKGGMAPVQAHRYVLLSGACAGFAVALKLSNGPLAILMPGLWVLSARGVRPRIAAVLSGSLAALATFVLAYGYWGALLWRHFGNPVFPFGENLFAPLRAWLGWVG